MSQFRFRNTNGAQISPPAWLQVWAARYPEDDYMEHDDLIARQGSFSGADFEEIGKWKDGAWTDGRWKPNVASVAYQIWMQAAWELPTCPEGEAVSDFLETWSSRTYTDVYSKGPVTKCFGLSRATTLLHFVSGESFPIFDARVRKAMTRLLARPVANTVRWYLDHYCPMFAEMVTLCDAKRSRTVDLALFAYGDKKLPFETKSAFSGRLTVAVSKLPKASESIETRLCPYNRNVATSNRHHRHPPARP